MHMPFIIHARVAVLRLNSIFFEQTNGDEDSTVPCFYTECDVVMKIVDIADHLEKKCLYRLEKCGYCKAQVNANVMKVTFSRQSQCMVFKVWESLLSSCTCELKQLTKKTLESSSVISCTHVSILVNLC